MTLKEEASGHACAVASEILQRPAKAAGSTLVVSPASRTAQPALVSAIRHALEGPRQPSCGPRLAALGKLVMTPDGRPIRTIVTGRRRLVTGSYASRKAGRAQVFESMNEHAFFMHSEVDTNVLDYRAQPFRLEFVLDGHKRIYIADCARLLADGSIEVIEIKGDDRSLQEPDYQQKLERVNRLCRVLGWTFTIVMRNAIFEPRARHRNIEIIQQKRMTYYDDRHIYTACELISRRGGNVELGELAGTLGCRAIGLSVAQALMVARIVRIDLHRDLSWHSTVELVAGSDGIERYGKVL